MGKFICVNMYAVSSGDANIRFFRQDHRSSDIVRRLLLGAGVLTDGYLYRHPGRTHIRTTPSMLQVPSDLPRLLSLITDMSAWLDDREKIISKGSDATALKKSDAIAESWGFPGMGEVLIGLCGSARAQVSLYDGRNRGGVLCLPAKTRVQAPCLPATGQGIVKKFTHVREVTSPNGQVVLIEERGYPVELRPGDTLTLIGQRSRKITPHIAAPISPKHQGCGADDDSDEAGQEVRDG